MPTTYWLKFGNTPLGYNGKALKTEYAPLQPKSVRFKFATGYTPTQDTSFHQWEWVQVSSSPNVWDLTIPTARNWAVLRNDNSSLDTAMRAATEVLTGDFTGATLAFEHVRDGWKGFFMGLPITKVGPLHNVGGEPIRLFYNCSSLVSVASISGSATNAFEMFRNGASLKTPPALSSGWLSFSNMFRGCTSLEVVPLYYTSTVTNVTNMFYGCTGVKSGALALYNQMANQATPPAQHNYCFYNCGSGTTSGAAELAQIPSGWK